MDFSALVPGQYVTIYTLFQRDSKGNNINLDNLNGLSFEVLQNDNDIVWDEKNWGNIRFPDITLK